MMLVVIDYFYNKMDMIANNTKISKYSDMSLI